MYNKKSERSPYTQLIYRPFWITVSCLLIILTIALSILINSSWRAVHRTEPLKAHMAMIEDIQSYNAELSNLTLKLQSPPTEKSLQQLSQLYLRMMDMLNTSKILNDEARELLLQVTYILENIKSNSSYDLSPVNKNIQAALHIEVGIQNNLLHLLARDNRIELKTTTFIAITLPLLGLVVLFFLRHRIFRPLDNLSQLITRVGRQTLPPVPLDDIDPLLKPLFADFSQLVERLSELEQIQNKHQLELENNVRHATQSLLEYQHTLAQSERLAAVGELTAGLAHELRNPLAGIHLTLANLRSEINDEDKVFRLSMVIEELERVTKLLNQVLGQSRHSPEPSSHFNLYELLNSLLQLVRYQVPASIKIELDVPNDLHCNLPQGRLRQAILNIILNSAQSIGQTPGVIKIKASNAQSKLSIQVFDSGQGFPQKLIENGVQPFMTGKDHGTGLGLAIVRRFCYEQGGELRLSNPPAGGACIEIILPASLSNE
ncbi:MAG: ATP-binding protein [Gammaproteobacteria bacterium]|nr:ATP-binding protein [Gammaproteobacteria bacterium]